MHKSASEKLKGSSPMSSRRVIVSGAEVVCRVEKTEGGRSNTTGTFSGTAAGIVR
ncbi:hypothetical protein [Geomonas ferrireducens]